MQQKEFEEGLALQVVETGELDEVRARALVPVEGGSIGNEELEDPDLEFGGLRQEFQMRIVLVRKGFSMRMRKRRRKKMKTS